jgi:hypothetical protein
MSKIMKTPGHVFLLNCLLILAFVTAGISPACHFTNGKATYIEICSGLELKTIKVMDDESPLGDENHHEHADYNPCAFCFSSSHLKLAATGQISIDAVSYDQVRLFDFIDYHTHAHHAQAPFAPRAPPLLSI